MNRPSLREVWQILTRLLAMLLIVLPALATAEALLESIVDHYTSSFINTFLTDLSLIAIAGTVPALVTSLAHTQLTRRLANASHPRARSTLFGAVLGIASGFGLGLLIAVIHSSLVPLFLLIPTAWGGIGGSLYGFLVGPAAPIDERAA